MDIFFGSYEDSVKADRAQWERFSYRRTQSKENFSQVLFRLLEVPEAANEDSGNVTMHQMMRLLTRISSAPSIRYFRQSAGITRESVRPLESSYAEPLTTSCTQMS
jgi:hypothetical protein